MPVEYANEDGQELFTPENQEPQVYDCIPHEIFAWMQIVLFASIVMHIVNAILYDNWCNRCSCECGPTETKESKEIKSIVV